MKPKTEFYTTGADGREEALLVVKTVNYLLGPCVTLLRRTADGKMGMGLQMPVKDLQAELEDELCGTITSEPVAEQKKLVGKVPTEMNAYFN